MSRAVRTLGVTLGTLLTLSAATLGSLYLWMSHTPQQRLPLPETLIALDSAQGTQLLAESSARADYDALLPYLQTQNKRSWCGVASAVTALNALRGSAALSQGQLFNACANRTRHWLRVSYTGMPLDSLGALLACHGAQMRVRRPDQSSMEQFRHELSTNLQNSGDFVLVNYQRAALGQEKTGHISPLGAYHAASDRWLILDVATYKYPPVWASTEALWNGMQAVDTETGQPRGYVIVSQTVPGSAPTTLVRDPSDPR